MKLYIDISHIFLWHGRMSGIERVEYNIVKHYLENGSNVTFVVWRQESVAFEICSNEEVNELIKKMGSNQQAEQLQPGQDGGKRLAGKLFKGRSKKKRALLRSEITRDDKVLVLDGLWDKAGYIDSLTELSKYANIDHIVYDMIPALFHGYVLDFMTQVFEKYMKSILPLCNRVYVISENTAKDTQRVLSEWGVVKKPKIIPFRLGDDILAASTPSKSDEQDSAEEFFLAAGTIEVRKNYPLLLGVYGLAREQNINLPKILIVGRKGWLSDNFVYIVEHDKYFSSKIKILENISDGKLAQMYKDALVVVCPSFYEGWGLPVREALAYGKVTLASRTSSLPEAGGVFADYFSPHDPRELLSLFVKYLDKNVRKKKQDSIRKGYEVCPWSIAIKEFTKIVEVD